jgi:hypothetical protein
VKIIDGSNPDYPLSVGQNISHGTFSKKRPTWRSLKKCQWVTESFRQAETIAWLGATMHKAGAWILRFKLTGTPVLLDMRKVGASREFVEAMSKVDVDPIDLPTWGNIHEEHQESVRIFCAWAPTVGIDGFVRAWEIFLIKPESFLLFTGLRRLFRRKR